MASTTMDPLQLLQAAGQAPQNSKEQAGLLATLRQMLEQRPAPIPILVGTLLAGVVNAADSLMKFWVIDLLYFAICRSTLTPEQKTQMSSQSLDALAQLLGSQNQSIQKVVIQCMATVYPLLFRFLCTNRNSPHLWETVSRCKVRILDFVWNASAPTGLRIAAIKFMQRVVLLQTRGVTDPRLANRTDPSISLCPADHPFISASKLEAEGQKLLEGIISMLYTSNNPDLISALINSWGSLAKLRPATGPLVIASLAQWTPSALTGQTFTSIRSVEKSIRILLGHLARIPSNGHQLPLITEALNNQAARLDKLVAEEKDRKRLAAEAKKRPPPMPAQEPDSKRQKLDPSTAAANANVLTSFDFTTLPAQLITDLIVSNLDAFSEAELTALVAAYRKELPQPVAPPPNASTSAQPQREVTPLKAEAEPEVEPEPMDPLQMDIDQDEMDYEPDRLNEELGAPAPQESATIDITSADLMLADFRLPAPHKLTEDEATSVISRVWNLGDDESSGGGAGTEMWMLLLVRMITRVVEPPPPEDEEDAKGYGEHDLVRRQDAYHEKQDQMRQTLCEYVMAAFSARIGLATTWMNEEWYNDRIRLEQNRTWRPNYDTWLNQLMVSYQTLTDGKDRTLSRFILDLPSIPSDILNLLRELAVDSESMDKMQVGFSTLRGLVNQRPSIREEALQVLLELTSHQEKRIRGAAINTVKIWVPHTQPMDTMIRHFSLQMLRKMQVKAVAPEGAVTVQPDGTPDNAASSTGDVPMANGETQTASLANDTTDKAIEEAQDLSEDLVQTPYLPDRIELPAQKDQVLQHMELMFALCVKVPDFLDEIFKAYGQMDITVQESIQVLLTPLIRSLGSSHGKLLTLLRTCPPGAESLALRVLTIFTEQGRPSAQLVALVKALLNERDLDPRFLIPIIAEMDKTDIIRHLPRIVSMLNGQAEPKALVKSVFSSIVTTPPSSFGSVSSNLPRMKQGELLTPAELMVLLHEKEKEIGQMSTIGLKSTIEAINICFSMTDVFRSEIFAVVMQQIMDKPDLPVLFLRTVIQAVTTYKTLVPFVSTTLLSRLITKKIWTNSPLWEGFIRCAKVTAPASFGALLQLPKDQLRELVDKQPTLKAGLRDHVTKKATNKARVAGLLDILGGAEEVVPPAAGVPQTPPALETMS